MSRIILMTYMFDICPFFLPSFFSAPFRNILHSQLWLLHKKKNICDTLTFTGPGLGVEPQPDEWQQDGPIRREEDEAYISGSEPSAFSQTTCRRQCVHCRAVIAVTLHAEPRTQVVLFYLFIIILLSIFLFLKWHQRVEGCEFLCLCCCYSAAQLAL